MSEETKHHKTDTHSYKGWLNSDSFWKRAFAIFGYNTFISFIIAIPIYIIMFLIALAAIGMFGMNMHHMRDDVSGSVPAGKVDIRAVCESLMANSGMENTAAAETYLKACIDGDYQEAVNAYIKMMGGDGKAI